MHAHIANLLICTNITGSDDHLLRSKSFYSKTICIKLLILRWIIFGIKIDKFGPEKSDTAGIVLLHKSDVRRTANVGINLDSLTIDCRIALSLKLLKQCLLLFFIVLLRLERRHQVLCRIDINAGIIAIDNRSLSVPFGLYLTALYQSRYTHRPR